MNQAVYLLDKLGQVQILHKKIIVYLINNQKLCRIDLDGIASKLIFQLPRSFVVKLVVFEV